MSEERNLTRTKWDERLRSGLRLADGIPYYWTTHRTRHQRQSEEDETLGGPLVIQVPRDVVKGRFQ